MIHSNLSSDEALKLQHLQEILKKIDGALGRVRHGSRLFMSFESLKTLLVSCHEDESDLLLKMCTILCNFFRLISAVCDCTAWFITNNIFQYLAVLEDEVCDGFVHVKFMKPAGLATKFSWSDRVDDLWINEKNIKLGNMAKIFDFSAKCVISAIALNIYIISRRIHVLDAQMAASNFTDSDRISRSLKLKRDFCKSFLDLALPLHTLGYFSSAKSTICGLISSILTVQDGWSTA
uniref:Uncharacterized protein n=1 Tax=Romanomermis culicivorax TaxID=13658 RepID=A0A915JDG0_ROMCU